MTAQEILKEYWGYDSFRPKQEEIVEAALEGRDVLAILPTGGGKSVCFQVPGMGLHFVNATTDRDYFLIQGLGFCYGVLIVIANLVVDLVLVALNPRLRSQGAA